jgi:hypothetical protein
MVAMEELSQSVTARGNYEANLETAAGNSGVLEVRGYTDYNGNPIIEVGKSLVTPKMLSALFQPEDIIASILPRSPKGGSTESIFKPLMDALSDIYIKQIDNNLREQSTDLSTLQLFERELFERDPFVEELKDSTVVIAYDEDTLLRLAKGIENGELSNIREILVPRNIINEIPKSIESLVTTVGEEVLTEEQMGLDTLNTSFTETLDSPITITGFEPELVETTNKLSKIEVNTLYELTKIFDSNIVSSEITLSPELREALSNEDLKLVIQKIEENLDQNFKLTFSFNEFKLTITEKDLAQEIVEQSVESSLRRIGEEFKEKEAQKQENAEIDNPDTKIEQNVTPPVVQVNTTKILKKQSEPIMRQQQFDKLMNYLSSEKKQQEQPQFTLAA